MIRSSPSHRVADAWRLATASASVTLCVVTLTCVITAAADSDINVSDDDVHQDRPSKFANMLSFCHAQLSSAVQLSIHIVCQIDITVTFFYPCNNILNASKLGVSLNLLEYRDKENIQKNL